MLGRIAFMPGRIKRVTWIFLGRWIFLPVLHENRWRDLFFYDAFMALSWNGISETTRSSGAWMARAVIRRRRPENPGHLRVGSVKDIWPHSAHR
jgi:hypothetical protein